MKMSSKSLTVLASPKSFTGHFAAIQEQALKSWTRLGASVEVVLYGDGQGIREAAERYGAAHVPDIACSASGAPLYTAIVEHARQHARYDLQIYLNADLLLPPDLLSQIAPVASAKYLISGQRIDLAEGVVWDLDADWQTQLSTLVGYGKAQLHGPSGMDYFIFPRGLWQELRPLVIGRGGYDNALLAFCLRRRIPVVDATAVIPAVHQWHGYTHVKGGEKEAHRGHEALRNYGDHDVLHSPPNIADADWVLTGGGLRRGNCRGDRLRFLETRLRYQCGFKLPSYLVRAAWRLIHGVRHRSEPAHKAVAEVV